MSPTITTSHAPNESTDTDSPWYELGEEPDYRFSLANERTFLAWIRTALALIAAGVGVTVIRPSPGGRVVLTTVGLLFTALALLISVFAYSQWAAKQKAMRRNQPLPRSRLLIPVCAALALIGAVLLATLPIL